MNQPGARFRENRFLQIIVACYACSCGSTDRETASKTFLSPKRKLKLRNSTTWEPAARSGAAIFSRAGSAWFMMRMLFCGICWLCFALSS